MNGNEQLIGILDCEDENQRLELVIEREGAARLSLKLATYSEGLGWHTQKTIPIDARQAEELQFLLGGARHLLKQTNESATQAARENFEVSERPQRRAAQVLEFAGRRRKSA